MCVLNGCILKVTKLGWSRTNLKVVEIENGLIFSSQFPRQLSSTTLIRGSADACAHTYRFPHIRSAIEYLYKWSMATLCDHRHRFSHQQKPWGWSPIDALVFSSPCIPGHNLADKVLISSSARAEIGSHGFPISLHLPITALGPRTGGSQIFPGKLFAEGIDLRTDGHPCSIIVRRKSSPEETHIRIFT